MRERLIGSGMAQKALARALFTGAAAALMTACGGGGSSGGSGGLGGSVGGSSPTTLIFSANDGSNGVEPWVSDGTESGTQMLDDINGSGGNSDPEGFTQVGDWIIFTAVDGDGRELWRTDGTPGGTSKIKDINPGQDFGVDPGQNFPVVDGYAYFRADDGGATFGEELWRTDGTPANTSAVADIRPGANASSNPQNLVAFDGHIFFSADDGPNGRELWISNGTSGGTNLFEDIYPVGNDSLPAELTISNGDLYFTAIDGTNGREPRFLGDAESSVQLIEDINSGRDSSMTAYNVIVPWAQGVAFLATDGPDNSELWTSEGLARNTGMVRDIDTSGSGIQNTFVPYVFNGEIYVAADDDTTGYQPWISGGGVGNTEKIEEINGSGNATLGGFMAYGGAVYFPADDGTTGSELWVTTTGTPSGTDLLADINTTANTGSFPLELTVFDGNLYFSADDGTGRELWRYDGSSASKVLSSGDATDVSHITAIE